MKRLIVGTLLLLLILPIFAESIKFDAENSYPNVLTVCFSMDVVNNREGIIEFEKVDGIVQTGISSFDLLAKKYNIINLKQQVEFVKDLDWNDNGAYPRNIYTIEMQDNNLIEEALTEFSNERDIIFAEYLPIMRNDFIPNDPMYNSEWHIPQIFCPEAWEFTTGSVDEDIVIGIVDAGIKWNHPDLRDNIWINQPELDAGMTINWDEGTVSGGNGIDDDGNGKIDDVIGWNFYGAGSNASYQDYPSNDHGTHVAGCAGAVGDNGIGVVGPSMNVKLISSRHAPTTFDYPYVSNGNSGIMYCADSGADVINCSWGGTGGASAANNAINYAIAQGAVVVCAAGNDNTNNGTTHHYPSDATNAIAVAATASGDLKSDFSNYGDPIDVCAPGSNIWSTIISNDGYASFQGTSMASPVAAGVVGLLISTHPDLEPMEVRQKLMDTCDNIDYLNPGYEDWLGAGRVNAYAAAMNDLIPNLTIMEINVNEVEGDGDGIPNPGERIALEIWLYNDFGWVNAEDVSVTISTELEGVEMFNDTSNYPDILSGIPALNLTAFEFATQADENIMDLPFTITISANESTSYPFNYSLDLIIPISLQQANWPIELGGGSKSASAIEDLDGDGVKEMIFANQTTEILAYKIDGTLVDGFPYDTGSQIWSALAVSDIDGNGTKEIVAATQSSVVCISNTGELIFEYIPGGQLRNNPMIADVDGNGTKEIIVANLSGNVFVLNSDGTDYAGFPVAAGGGVLTAPAIGDIDNDGILDIVLSLTSNSISVISCATATVLPGWPQDIGARAEKGLIVTNIDADEEVEIVTNTLAGDVYAFNHDGTLIFSNNYASVFKSSVVSGDLNNNGNTEIVSIAENGDVYIIDNNGAVLDGFPINVGVNVECSPILADMNNDGTIEILFGDNLGYFHSIDIEGLETANFPLFFDGPILYSASIADADGDGDQEICVANHVKFFLIDYKNPVNNIVWPCFKGSSERTANIQYVVENDGTGVINSYSTSLNNNYPNPFNPTTKISFTLENEEFVDVSIYNLKGQMVKKLISGIRGNGYNEVMWSGKDDSGNNVSSGLYFYKLTTKESSSTKKMMLLK